MSAALETPVSGRASPLAQQIELAGLKFRLRSSVRAMRRTRKHWSSPWPWPSPYVREEASGQALCAHAGRSGGARMEEGGAKQRARGHVHAALFPGPPYLVPSPSPRCVSNVGRRKMRGRISKRAHPSLALLASNFHGSTNLTAAARYNPNINFNISDAIRALYVRTCGNIHISSRHRSAW